MSTDSGPMRMTGAWRGLWRAAVGAEPAGPVLRGPRRVLQAELVAEMWRRSVGFPSGVGGLGEETKEVIAG